METGFKLKNENPKENANIISKLCFTWMIKLFYKGKREGLKITDLFKIEKSNSSEKLTDLLGVNWNNELTKAKLNNRKPKFIRAIFATFLWNYMLYGLFLFITHVILRSIQPVVLSNLIVLFKNPTNEKDNIAMYISAALLIILSVLIVFFMHHAQLGQATVGMRIRIAVSSLIYRKILKLNKKSLGQTAIGQIFNILSNDANRFDLVVLVLHYVWMMPFQTALVTYLIWQQVGMSALAGVASMAILTLPVQGYLGKLASDLRIKVAHKADYRITLMNEIISGIQVIKMYAWEKPFKKVVQMARLKEVQALITTSYLRGIYLSSLVYTERVTLFITVISHVLQGNTILAEQVFSMAQFFNLLQLTMSIFYPLSVSHGAETLVSITRIENLLTLDEIEDTVIEKDFQKGVEMRNVNASWESSKPVLDNLNVNIQPGVLCVVIGPVGAGKSSFLQLLLGELKPDFGTIKIEGNISYSSQDPWLFSSTIRNNVLFGEQYNKKLYNKIIKVCALEKDFDQFPHADKMMVGERGSSLSGGQRARVNLARAVYRQADIYLFDDPLSAVDTHVGKHLFEECIIKYLNGKTRILVTHQLQYLKKADIIIVLNNGKIEAQGTFEELSKSNLDFTSLLAPTNENIDKQNEQDNDQKTSLLSSHSLILDSLDLRNESFNQHDEEQGASPTSPSAFKEYIKFSGHWCTITILLIIFVMGQIACSCADYWITFWTQQEALKNLKGSKTDSFLNSSYHHNDLSLENEFNSTANNANLVPNKFLDTNLAIYVYSTFIVSCIILTLIRSLFYFKLAMNASINLHNKMFSTLLEAPMNFFNTNPAGRILNRFSKDMGAVDELLPRVLLEAMQITLVMCGILVMVIISNVYMLVPMVILGAIFLQLRSWFIKTSKDIKHLEGITKSVVFSHLNSSLLGITSIRAFNAEDILKHEFDGHQDVHTSAWLLTILCMVAFGLWLDIICVLFIASTVFSFIILNQYTEVNASLVGLAISQSLVLTGMLQYGIRQSAEVINQLTSVERILQYTTLEKEGPFEALCENFPPKNWPNKGQLEMQNLSLRYSRGSPLVLQNLNVKINSGEKIGIVGRTGAGKSSLISALFRLARNEGNILIDGVNTKLLGLTDLRRYISIIPQEPVLFSATLRYNLDPFNEFDDFKLWSVLEEVELKDIAKTLDYQVSSGGNNFSVGQRQLICLARAILGNNKILILDEATANIDPKTDALIQATIRKKFQTCTVLTIAHRLDTIMDSDKIIVMESGHIIEYDHPYLLLQNTDNYFYKMVSETGQLMSEHLRQIAFVAYSKKIND